MVKRTKKLNAKEYGSYEIYDREQHIKKLVNQEADFWHANDFPVPLPVQPSKVEVVKVRTSAGFINFFRELRP